MKPAILGVEIGTENKKEIFRFVERALREDEAKFIVTLNSEIILKAQDDEDYRSILNEADLKLVDGFSMKLMSWLKNIRIGERLAGANLADFIVKKAEEKKCKLGVVIKKNGLSSRREVEDFFKGQNDIKVIEIDSEKDANLAILSENSRCDVLLVGLGASWQEKFIWQAKQGKAFKKLAIGVGGTIDFWTGKQKRAPQWMGKIGMEWFWRLVTRPNRFFRIWNATVVFLWKGLAED